MGRWNEGLLFEGISPHPWLKSAANWFPNTENVQPNEMRIHFMGTAPMIRPGQMNTSIWVMLGNGDNFAFDVGEGSVANYVAEETVAEVREHWKGPFHFGAPDGIVVNVTKDQIWVREGVLPDFPNSKAPQFNFDNGQLIVPHPPTSRQETQNQWIRDQELDPTVYYPEGYTPELLEEWPVDSDLVVPVEQMPENLQKSMGDRWRSTKENQRALEEQAKENDPEE